MKDANLINAVKGKRALKNLCKITDIPRKLPKFAFLGCRTQPDVRIMLERASKDHPNISQIVNACLRSKLSELGYGDGKRVKNATPEKAVKI